MPFDRGGSQDGPEEGEKPEASRRRSDSTEPLPEDEHRAEHDAQVKAVDKMEADYTQLEKLRLEGHGPQRHLDVTDGQLRSRLGQPVIGEDGIPLLKPNGEVRSRDNIDPITGTTVDGVHGGRHRCGAAATAFGTAEDYVAAETYLRDKAINDGRLAPEFPIESVLGKDAEGRMRGVRHDTKVAGQFVEVDFTGGAIQASYKWDDDGNLLCTTLFPKPAPDRQE